MDSLEKCPLCQTGNLKHVSGKKLFGLMKTEDFECEKCSSVLSKKGENYKLAKTSNTDNKVWRDYSNQTLAAREWNNITKGGMSDAKQKEADMEHWLTELKKGKLKIKLGTGSAVMLKKGEEEMFTLPNISLSEPRAVRTGHYGGSSFRVAKGVSFRLGSFQSQSHEEIKPIDQGNLTLTNKRIIFSGQKRTSNILLNKIISLEPYSDGFNIKKEGRNRAQYFIGINKATLGIKIENREYQEPISGLILKYMVEGLRKT